MHVDHVGEKAGIIREGQMNGVSRLFVTATIAGCSTYLAPSVGNAAIMVSRPFDIVVPEAQGPGPVSLGTGPFNVSNLDPNFTATITNLVPSVTLTGGDGTDFVNMPTLGIGDCAIGLVLTRAGTPGDSCFQSILLNLAVLEPGENTDAGNWNVTLRAIAGALTDTATIGVTVTDPGFVPEPNTLALLGAGVAAIAMTGFLRRSRRSKPEANDA
jgi:hypothetical protein